MNIDIHSELKRAKFKNPLSWIYVQLQYISSDKVILNEIRAYHSFPTEEINELKKRCDSKLAMLVIKKKVKKTLLSIVSLSKKILYVYRVFFSTIILTR